MASSCGRAHAIKAALLVGFILVVLLNFFSYHYDVKFDKLTHIQTLSHTSSPLLWPKRTRSSSEVANITHSQSSTSASVNATAASPIANSSAISVEDAKSAGNTSTTASLPHILNETLPMDLEHFTKAPKRTDVTTRSTKFFKNIMTNLGLNACPPAPPDLEGPIEVNLTSDTMSSIERWLAPKLKPGGWYRPTECNAKDHVAIVVPFRDREPHLPIFLKNLHPFLQRQQVNYGIFVVEQTTGNLFNRAALMNVGFKEASKMANWDCFIFHDVDLLPMDDRNLYVCPDQPRHMSVAVDTFGFKLPYSTIFGGVSAMTTKQFRAVNGFSNSFWGWGGEDDDMSNRLKHMGFHIARYPINIARYTMLTHKKEKANPKRYEKLVTGSKRFETDGLNSVRYSVKDIQKKPLYTWILVEIQDGS
ncbi:beta-1,4-N-acetylgalactosaminyltransferase bre-4 isoform X2 [Lutzomyia longipalpis]|uniref:beta-1,4-N-acetylgalactosaminyltransferase bre-4 isoform X2 n=1 Tax=Lutzomyia longipalpis TaxID=7200 RepID=UPI0024837BBE|nr:beta-1,4-N-acetylgalactosaminyltransferase bre-4 isoform X2 [Lutzomyia longipalpis]